MCRRCGRVVLVSKELFHEAFEQMHALCFQPEFEHGGDPDLPCSNAACRAANKMFLEPLTDERLWKEGFTTIPYRSDELDKLLQGPPVLGPDDVRKVIRQARFTIYLTRELLRNYASDSDDANVRIAKAALGAHYSEELSG
jgi:hypothetical protein